MFGIVPSRVWAISILTGLFVNLPAPVRGVTVGFEGVVPPGSCSIGPGLPHSESGFDLFDVSPTNQSAVIEPCASGVNSNGTAVLAWRVLRTFGIAEEGGVPFNLVSFDATNATAGSGTLPYTIDVKGFPAGGGTVEQSFGITPNQFVTFFLGPGWSDLARAEFTAGNFDNRPGDNSVIDNIVVEIDSDQDGIPDDLDNCPFASNPDQVDNGGINTTDPDGIGDACQCGEVTGNGVVNGQDGFLITRKGLGFNDPIFLNGGNCDVTGNGECNGQDGLFTTRAGLGFVDPLDLAPQGQNCHNANPDALPCPSCEPCPSGLCGS